MADFSLWHDGLKWRYEVTTAHGRKRGWRPTQVWAKGAALRHVHDPLVPCEFCGKDIDSVARRCMYCGAWVDVAPEPARTDLSVESARAAKGTKARPVEPQADVEATKADGVVVIGSSPGTLPKRRPPVMAQPGVSASFATAGAPLPPAHEPAPSHEAVNTFYRVVLGLLVGTIVITVVGLALVIR